MGKAAAAFCFEKIGLEADLTAGRVSKCGNFIDSGCDRAYHQDISSEKERIHVENKKAFGEYIRQKRMEAGLTQRNFADRLYVTESAVSKWERGGSLR